MFGGGPLKRGGDALRGTAMFLEEQALAEGRSTCFHSVRQPLSQHPMSGTQPSLAAPFYTTGTPGLLHFAYEGAVFKLTMTGLWSGLTWSPCSHTRPRCGGPSHAACGAWWPPPARSGTPRSRSRTRCGPCCRPGWPARGWSGRRCPQTRR